jgi:hypothetical protein
MVDENAPVENLQIVVFIHLGVLLVAINLGEEVVVGLRIGERGTAY